eukprot:CAMPEP_0194132030 /NCGR_PEP_ID=MMETSP0152-20130528/2601_1 /TAXON_ID=1049557 /ORGANISM="Thalassiothrix antarctica, Strain L6-D1" /LENGTH=167 /DNA_ID=CAMNT_0038826943 /DNA_START=450 /DNA_END=953 /DNA_ORIENTATION=-
MLLTAGGFHIVLNPFSKPKVSPISPAPSAKQRAGSISSWEANSAAAVEDPTPIKYNLLFLTAGRTTSRSCTACSQHRNHPKCRRNAQTTVSSAIPKGVFCLQRDVSGTELSSDALTRGILSNAVKTDDDELVVEESMTFGKDKAWMVPINPRQETRNLIIISSISRR